MKYQFINFKHLNIRNSFQISNFKFQIFLIGLFIYLFIGLFASAAEAATQSLRVSPVIINVSLSPGKTYNHTVTVENLTNLPLPLRTSLNDFMTSGEEGGYVFAESKTNPLLSWVKLDQSEFIINPKEKKKIRLTITTPTSIPLGGYYGVLFFEPVVQNAAPNGARVSSKVGVLMLANVGVPDPKAEKAQIATFSTDLISQNGIVPLMLRVKNISLNFFTAKPILTLHPIIPFIPGAQQREVTLEDKIIFPGQIRRWTEESVVQGLKPNVYRADMAVSTGNGQYVKTEKYFIIFPYIKVLIILTVLLIIGFIIKKRSRLKSALQALYK